MQSKTLSRSAVFALVAEPQRKIKHCDQPHRHQHRRIDGGRRPHRIEIRRAQYEELSGAGVLERFDASIRDSKFTAMYEEFIDNVVHLAVEEYRESEKKILTAFESGLELTPSHPFFKELEKALKKR